MSDIVDRLIDHAPHVDRWEDERGPIPFAADLKEAAAELARLRAENERMREALRGVVNLLSETMDWHDNSSHEWAEECPWEMREVFTDEDLATLSRARAALSEDAGE